jgi:hypothetical protein
MCRCRQVCNQIDTETGVGQAGILSNVRKHGRVYSQAGTETGSGEAGI